MIKPLQTIAALCLALTPAMAAADEVTFSFGDTIVLTADFAGFQGDTYIVIHNGQKLRVPARLVTCEGADCLIFEQTSDITLVSGDL